MVRTLWLGAAASGVLALAGHASGAIMFEAEPNNSLASAQFLTTFTFPGDALAVDGSLGASGSDVDWYEFALADAASVLIAALAPVGMPASADGQMMLVTGAGDVIEWDDDDGPGVNPAIIFQNLPAGSYYIGISGFDDISFPDDPVATDELFDGFDSGTGNPHGEIFNYKLSLAINVVPAPGVGACIALTGLISARRRR